MNHYIPLSLNDIMKSIIGFDIVVHTELRMCVGTYRVLERTLFLLIHQPDRICVLEHIVC